MWNLGEAESQDVSAVVPVSDGKTAYTCAWAERSHIGLIEATVGVMRFEVALNRNQRQKR